MAIYLTFTQSMHLAGVIPCLIILTYILQHHSKSVIILPSLLFLSLICGFISPLLPALFISPPSPLLSSLLILGEQFEQILSYLFIVQLLLRKVPSLEHYWIMAVPFLGSSGFIYASQISSEVCIGGDSCFNSTHLFLIYRVITNSFVLMLLITFMNPYLPKSLLPRKATLPDAYWLILALILFNVLSLFIDLTKATDYLMGADYMFAKVVIRIGFVYVVFSSIFRLFPSRVALSFFSFKNVPLTTEEAALLTEINLIFQEEKLYRNMGITQQDLAKHFNLKEALLCYIIHAGTGKSVTEFVNEYRIKEAKDLLISTQHPITAIAFDTGFNSITSFHQVFKEMTGHSPSEFRNQALMSLHPLAQTPL